MTMNPPGIHHVLEDVIRRYNLSVMITENGLAGGVDASREWRISRRTMERTVRLGAQRYGNLMKRTQR